MLNQPVLVFSESIDKDELADYPSECVCGSITKGVFWEIINFHLLIFLMNAE